MTRALHLATSAALAWWIADTGADIARDGFTRESMQSALFALLWLAGMRADNGRG